MITITSVFFLCTLKLISWKKCNQHFQNFPQKMAIQQGKTTQQRVIKMMINKYIDIPHLFVLFTINMFAVLAICTTKVIVGNLLEMYT